MESYYCKAKNSHTKFQPEPADGEDIAMLWFFQNEDQSYHCNLHAVCLQTVMVKYAGQVQGSCANMDETHTSPTNGVLPGHQR
jgi:hypothetical protein